MALLGGPIQAQTYPQRAVSWVVPYPAGGPADVIARAIAPRMAKELGQPVLIENLGGAGGAIAAQKVLGAPADGYTLFQGSPNEVILAPLANAAVKIRLEDFTFVSPFTDNPLVLLTRGDFPAKSVDEIGAYLRARSAPLATYGSVGPGSMFHLAGEALSSRLGVKMLHVPYKGGAPLLQDLGGGTVDFALLPFTTSYIGFAQTGRLKIIAVASPARIPGLKNTPTVNESSSVKNFVFSAWAGLMVKRGTPAAIVARLHEALARTMADPQVRAALEAQGSQVIPTMPLADAAAFLQSEAVRYRALAAQAGVKPQ